MSAPQASEAKTVFVYGLMVLGGPIRYIGVSSNIERRINRHMTDMRAGSQLPSHRWMRKHGRPKYEILATCEGYPAAYSIERELVAEYRNRPTPLLNVASGGEGSDGSKGRKLTEAHKAAIARANAGHGLGSKRPKWHCEAISRGQKGKPKRPRSLEHRQKMSKALKGIPRGPMSQETRNNLGESLKKAWEIRRANGKGSKSPESRAKLSESLRRYHQRKRDEAAKVRSV